MIEETKGNLLKSDAEALVNTVNCVGFMGKGIALQFKKAFPQNFDAYENACKKNEVQVGKMFVWESSDLFNKKTIINFPTKRHYRGNSQIEDIKNGLHALVQEVQQRNIRSIAVPPLGCGLGGLLWDEVKPLIISAFDQLPEVRVLLYSPSKEPTASERVNRTEKPPLTRSRALFIKLMQQYLGLNYQLTQLEVQKLAYFLQEAEEPLKLNYSKHIYGPYADNLNKVLELMDGHYIQGYSGSRAPDIPLELLPGAVDEADSLLKKECNGAIDRLNKVGNLIMGFETPYGMELLSSVHWVSMKDNPRAQTSDEAVKAIANWTSRKRQLMKPEHIQLAYNHLKKAGWILET